MLRFYLDEHIDPRIARALRARGIDVLTAQEAGRSNRGIPDPIQLSYAAVQGRVLVTGDWDFLNYAYAVHPHAGVTILPRNVSIGEAILYLEILAHTRRDEDYANQLLVYPALCPDSPLEMPGRLVPPCRCASPYRILLLATA